VKRLLAASGVIRLLILAAVVVGLPVASILSGSFAIAQDEDNELIGDYTVSITDESIPQDIANGESVVGRWRISFGADGSYEGARLDLGEVLVRGTYSVDGDKVTITDQEGLVSCSNEFMRGPQAEDVSVGVYQFDLDADGLTLIPDVDNCALRLVLLSTNTMVPFIACTTEPIELASTGGANNDPGARGPGPQSGEEATAEASPATEPAVTPIADEDLTTEDQIDNLLAQMTACWATGDPGRFLALWSEDFRTQFLEDETALDSLRAAMQVPLSWERAGDVRMDGDDRAEAVVRSTTLDEEEFVRFLFVLENGAWLWDGSAADDSAGGNAAGEVPTSEADSTATPADNSADGTT
jgi:hypothetical protein